MDKIDFFKTLKTNKDKVEMLLIKHPSLRDNDNKLIATFWFKQLGDSIDNMQGYDLLKQFAEGNLTNAETIRRLRQKIQQTEIDSAVKFNLGFPMWFFELADFTGLDVIHKATLEMHVRDKKVILPHPTIEQLFNEKKLGQKSGEGFYKY